MADQILNHQRRQKGEPGPRGFKGAAGSSGGSAITIKDEGAVVTAAPTSIDFVGAGVTVTGAAAVTVTVPGNPLTVKDEGTNKSTSATSMDFVGTGVTVTNTGDAITVTIPGATPGVTYDWNQLDGMAGLICVHGNGKSVTSGYTGVRGAMRGVTSHSTGKYYFEFLVNVPVTGGSPDIGVGTSTAVLTDYVGGNANSWGMFMNGSSAFNGAFLGQNTYAAGDIVGIAVDFTAATGSVKFFKNNVAQTNAYTGLTLGTLFPMVSMEAVNTNPSGTLNLRAADQTYAPPIGYSSWS